jgi:acetylornithine deacetylase
MPHEGANAVFAAASVLAALELLASQIAKGSSHPILGTGTLSVGMVRGGSAPNIVPDTCEIIVDRRLVPGETAEMATAQVRSCLNGILAGRQGVTVSVDDPWLTCPPLPECVPDLVLESLLRKVQRHVPNSVTRPVSFGTDASSLAQIGIPSMVFGPGGIEQAHTKDEWVEIEQLNQAVSILFDCVAGIGHR